jgi:diguanylate cyclase (GGDEF)-like protein/PAS domain S-box-containing protein
MKSENSIPQDHLIDQWFNGQNALCSALFEEAKDGIVILDTQGRALLANRQFADMLGYTKEEITRLHVWNWDTKFSQEELQEKLHQIDHNGHHFETLQKTKHGADIYVELSNSATWFKDQKFIFCICRDITERKLTEKKIFRHATTDHLTTMLNRREFVHRLRQEMDRARRYGTIFSLIMYDFDNFKSLKKTFGHNEGDRALKLAAELVKKNIRSTDISARWSNEEFIVLLPQTPLSVARGVAEKLRQTIEVCPFHECFAFRASFGVTTFQPRDDLYSLIKRVDDALYWAKAETNNCVKSLKP